MSRPLRIPRPQTPLHLYRHLLREASYLPPLARLFVDNQIRDRFEKDRKDDEEEGTKHIRKARHELRVLRAANCGDLTRMRRVLLRAFGRVGRRRRELMTDLLHREVPTNTEELEQYAAAASALAALDRPLDWLDNWDVEKLRTFARSQVQAGLINPPKAPITVNQTSPDKLIPSENAWGRPLAAKPARTKLRNLWKSVADKCMPPLPKEEWETLGEIAEGKMQEQWLPPHRRPVARGMSGDVQGARTWDWQSYAIKPVAVVDRPANRRNKLLSGTVDDNTPTGDPQPIDCHKYTARSWRRLLGNVWRLSPIMEQKPDGRGGWNIAWGKVDFQAAQATPASFEFFGDFPDAGEPKIGGKGRT
ncbi:hypothetical protein C8A00DRAFT_41350 [Chaetomidium leptoderma]|uniref:LYR motif-containing protein Cup1-like N-terminal domain-containing protein n=1 Tax=Chaetomidium leptoderma TaxID=669021 RepID=A0AAN6VQR4_9PEZI|nr:hypothetical protein C8A00DRAFT_41350 [Chaetomidium leptoderma]